MIENIWIFDGRVRVPYRPTDDEVVYSKRLGNKVLVDLNRSNPLTVIWDALVGQKFKCKDQILKEWAFWVHKFRTYASNGERSVHDGNHEQNKMKKEHVSTFVASYRLTHTHTHTHVHAHRHTHMHGCAYSCPCARIHTQCTLAQMSALLWLFSWDWFVQLHIGALALAPIDIRQSWTLDVGSTWQKKHMPTLRPMLPFCSLFILQLVMTNSLQVYAHSKITCMQSKKSTTPTQGRFSCFSEFHWKPGVTGKTSLCPCCGNFFTFWKYVQTLLSD